MSYVDDDTLYLCSENIETLWKKLKQQENTFWMGFKQVLKAKTDKYYLVLSSDESFSINIDNE